MPHGPLYTKILERKKFLLLMNSNGDFERKMKISSVWIDNIFSTDNLIRTTNYEIEIFTDDSLSGWGAACDEQSTHDWWSRQQQESHINYLKLDASR